jgi:hypothetical protein
MLDTSFPRLVGDVGNPRTFEFPVRYRRVVGAAPELLVAGRAVELLPAFIEGATALERDGVAAVTTTCGLMARVQPELAKAVRVPVFASSLLLVPAVHRMLGPDRRVGILAASSARVDEDLLAGVGVGPEIPVAVAGFEHQPEFTRVFVGNATDLDVTAVRSEHVRVATRLVEQHPDVGAIVLECVNMSPFIPDIHGATGLPVFDIVALLRLVQAGMANGRRRR